LAGLLVLLAAPSRTGLLASMAAFGLGFAAADTMVTKVIPEAFGVRAIGALMGGLSFGWRCGAALGPVVAGVFYDAMGSYAVPFGAAPVVVLASWGFFALGHRSRPRAPDRGAVP